MALLKAIGPQGIYMLGQWQSRGEEAARGEGGEIERSNAGRRREGHAQESGRKVRGKHCRTMAPILGSVERRERKQQVRPDMVAKAVRVDRR